MGKYERIIRIPAVDIDESTAVELAHFMHALAEERVTAVLRERLTQTYQSLPLVWAQAGHKPGGEQEIQQYLASEPYRDLIRPAFGDKYTFLSPHGNSQFLFNDFNYADIPPDLLNLIAEATGSNGEIISLNIKASTQVTDFLDHNINRVMIQGPEKAWVNDTAKKFETVFAKTKQPFRNFVYHFIPLFVWTSFFSCTVIEYKIVRRLTGLKWDTPLNGLQLLLCFAILTLTLVLCANLFTRVLHFTFPYFELEKNLSLTRVAWRWPIIGFISFLYATGLGLLLKR